MLIFFDVGFSILEVDFYGMTKRFLIELKEMMIIERDISCLDHVDKILTILLIIVNFYTLLYANQIFASLIESNNFLKSLLEEVQAKVCWNLTFLVFFNGKWLVPPIFVSNIRDLHVARMKVWQLNVYFFICSSFCHYWWPNLCKDRSPRVSHHLWSCKY